MVLYYCHLLFLGGGKLLDALEVEVYWSDVVFGMGWGGTGVIGGLGRVVGVSIPATLAICLSRE